MTRAKRAYDVVLPAGVHLSDRPRWLAARRRLVCSSDVAKLFGASRYGSQYTVWVDKTGRLPDEPATVAQARGIEAEPFVINHWIRHYATYKMRVRSAGLLRSRRYRRAGGDVDRLETCDAYGQGIIEAKTQTGEIEVRWGTEGEPLVPVEFIFQGQWLLFVTGRDHIHYIVMGPFWQPFERVMWRDDELIERMLCVAARFWGAYVITDLAPPAEPADVETVKRLHPSPVKGTTYVLDSELAATLMHKVNAEAKVIARHELRRAMALAELKALVGGATEIVWEDGTTAATWRPTRAIDGADAAWMRENAELVARYSHERTVLELDLRKLAADYEGRPLPTGLRRRRSWLAKEDPTLEEESE